ncbi:regulator of chromosome condensation 1/beta-lactamase-inhibitor protein II [Phyllosticta citriasiana]|uniref:regulator of chromosome condensation 1/beta-lactamase-inhibitor protein II n=1 Tax=Phyllosticta citriasiana TaxID=595635 RepID=UPI0030FD933C
MATAGEQSSSAKSSLTRQEPPLSTQSAPEEHSTAATSLSPEEMTPLTERPLDVLLLIVPHLDAASFNNLTKTCRAFYDESFRLDPAYWAHITRETFRLPNQPAVDFNGQLWQRLYKRLLTQTHVFTWGNNDHGALGQENDDESDEPPRPRWPRLRGPILRRGGHHPTRVPIDHRAYPCEMVKSKDLGVISDMQCGGWSTTLLTSRGSLHTSGTIGNDFVSQNNLQPLIYPPGYPKPTERQDEVVTIRQFSSGRSHILGLSDSGRIWSWYSVKEHCRRITFLHVDTIETKDASSKHEKRGVVRKVVAGWNASSAYVTGSGIILWKPHGRSFNATDDKTADTVEILESIQVPNTSYTRPLGTAREPDDASRELGLNIGEVINHIVLEHFVVFVTDLGKFYAARFEWDAQGNGGSCAGAVELAALSTALDKKHRVDIQGSFRSFAAFRNEEVVTANQDYLNACFDRGSDNADIEGLKRIPALQNAGVISVAFGDHHYHALKKDGSILSFGRESQACGSLGLGGEGEAEKRLRGQYYDTNRIDNLLVQHAYTTGRQIWFDEVKRKWVTYISSGGYDPGDAQDRIRQTAHPRSLALAEVSEWIEQQGRDWDKHPDLADANEDGLGSHFALTVTAAGWHSGAIVLVNEELAKRTIPRIDPSEFVDPVNHGASPGPGFWYRWADHHFPRLELSNGEVMPSAKDVPLDRWKDGVRPSWVLGQNFS